VASRKLVVLQDSYKLSDRLKVPDIFSPQIWSFLKRSFPGMLRRVALVKIDISEERIASIFRVKWITELGTTSAVNSNWNTLRRNAICSSETSVLTGETKHPKHPIQKDKFFILTVVKTSNLIHGMGLERTVLQQSPPPPGKRTRGWKYII
jgi:hypothetical protein